ncbi:hypothetical protein B0T26DRAFT_429387 [Lasiosphaeria miniovina]|uniref:Uncharacterized protein n=1 Tax=Lasiosphaeria miniovina TaxID=1954250 RepID=A0AA40A673_9PEZI|nr:uncharacterized protein B0T26DRAFT_429387 [Lasiosphaeria miniovina]KAK0709960.1 hypothetical protein B0T26DRAFT_429387 [Lasiosphaeria miniovina]
MACCKKNTSSATRAVAAPPSKSTMRTGRPSLSRSTTVAMQCMQDENLFPEPVGSYRKDPLNTSLLMRHLRMP